MGRAPGCNMGICGSSNDKPGGTGTRRHDTGMGACHIKIEWAKDNFQEVEMELSLTVLHLKQRLPEVLDRCAAPHFESDVKQYLSDKPSFWEGLSVCNAGTGMLTLTTKSSVTWRMGAEVFSSRPKTGRVSKLISGSG